MVDFSINKTEAAGLSDYIDGHDKTGKSLQRIHLAGGANDHRFEVAAKVCKGPFARLISKFYQWTGRYEVFDRKTDSGSTEVTLLNIRSVAKRAHLQPKQARLLIKNAELEKLSASADSWRYVLDTHAEIQQAVTAHEGAGAAWCGRPLFNSVEAWVTRQPLLDPTGWKSTELKLGDRTVTLMREPSAIDVRITGVFDGVAVSYSRDRIALSSAGQADRELEVSHEWVEKLATLSGGFGTAGKLQTLADVYRQAAQGIADSEDDATLYIHANVDFYAQRLDTEGGAAFRLELVSKHLGRGKDKNAYQVFDTQMNEEVMLLSRSDAPERMSGETRESHASRTSQVRKKRIRNLNKESEILRGIYQELNVESSRGLPPKPRSVVHVRSNGVQQGVLHMKPFKAGDLHDNMKRLAKISVAKRAKLMADACAGMSAVHQTSYAHGDIKPENIFLAEDEEGNLAEAVAADFGGAGRVQGYKDVSETPCMFTSSYVTWADLQSGSQAKRGKNDASLKEIMHSRDVLAMALSGIEVLLAPQSVRSKKSPLITWAKPAGQERYYHTGCNAEALGRALADAGVSDHLQALLIAAIQGDRLERVKADGTAISMEDLTQAFDQLAGLSQEESE